MLRISNIRVPVNYSEADLKEIVTRRLKVESVQSISIWKKSLDARKKSDLSYLLTVDVSVNVEEDGLISRLKDNCVAKAVYFEYVLPAVVSFLQRPIIVGFGPAGMFAALILAECGARPIVIERGSCVEKRAKDVKAFFTQAVLNEASNIQFGEGGAGTFSDGKLNTGIKDKRISKVLHTFVENGAPDEILYESKPHIGTDKLPDTVKNIRKKIIALGGDVLFDSVLTGIQINDNRVTGIKYIHNGVEDELYTDALVLAIGHSARDTFKMIYDLKVPMEAKPFSVGARIEHLAKQINQAQYGNNYPQLPTADYKLAAHLDNGRGVYTFCMCPGGTVVAASSLHGHVVTNGMSNFARDAVNSNSALLVGITPQDFQSDHPLAGIEYQEKIEKNAFTIAGGNYRAPAQRVEDFLSGRKSNSFGDVTPSYAPGVTPTDINSVLPQYVCESMKCGIKLFARKLHGFDYPDAVLTAPETRSSSPVRILRNDDMCSIGVMGLYPCGEGAGYAGGITSAAVDGIRSAEAIINNKRKDV